MSPIPINILFFLVLISSIIGFISGAPTHLYTYCPTSNTTTLSSSNRSQINSLLSNLSSSANLSSTPAFNYLNSNSSSFHALYLCRGDIDSDTCRACVAFASSDLPQKCPTGSKAVIFYDECEVRYSNASFFAQLDTSSGLQLMNTQNVTANVPGFNQVLAATLFKVSTEAAEGSSAKKFAMEEAQFSEFQTLYTMAQCTPDLSSSDCSTCLDNGLNVMSSGYKQGWRVMSFSCTLHYEIYKFYKQGWRVMSFNCPNTTDDNSLGDRLHIDALLSSLSSAANHSSALGRFYTGTTKPSVFGLYLCRADIAPTTCRDCVAAASAYLRQGCPRGKQAAVLYDVCMIRYSNESFSGHLDPNLNPMWSQITQSSMPTFQIGYALGVAIDRLKNQVAQKVENGKMFGTYEESINGNMTLYVLGQCTPDLSSDDCGSCLQHCVEYITNESSTGNTASARVYFFSCNLRFENYRFYSDPLPATEDSPAPTSPSPSPSPSTPPKPKKRHIPLIITGSFAISILLLSLGLVLCSYVSRRKVKASSTDDFTDMGTAESLQMDLNTIQAATQNFAIDKKLGQGGFGAVYKGTLQNGQDIAVKRLSDNSGQGIVEFKTEVLLVAKLQHRNLVKLLGFCASGVEKIVVYEFLPNSSLDKILFDLTKRKSLDWEMRFKIICGIAKGLMYLHEDSRLRVIHRDLKSSNILLDEAMNPKISDFGLAKLFGVDQTQAVTESIAGTYGYMAPEYVLMGHYSIKSDVYSFGVIVLEVVSGQRNKYINRPLLEEALLYRAWRFWHEGEALKLVDEALGDKYSREDVMKCIHIGLLCIQESVARRPNMTSVVAALGGQSITLPLPSAPNFFNSSNQASTTNTGSSGISSGQGGSIRDTASEITELHGR